MKNVPLRQCIGCGERREKKELMRIVLQADGTLAADPTGKLPGRGAYLCRDAACLAKAQKKNALSKAFRQSIPQPAYEALRAQFAGEQTVHEASRETGQEAASGAETK